MIQTVVVTGISGNLGRALTRVLHGNYRVLGVDRRPFPGRPADVQLFQVDVRKRALEDVFRRNQVDAVVHMGIMHDPRMSFADHHSFNVLGTTRVLSCAARYGVKKVVVLSSANVYGPSPDNSNFLMEDAPLMGASRFASVRDLVEVDMLAHAFFWKQPTIETVVLRPVHTVGRTIKNAPSNYLRLARPWTLSGFDPLVQLIHMDDVALAMGRSLRLGLKGVFNVVGPGIAPLSAVIKELGKTPLSLPHPIARVLLKNLFRYRFAGYPPEELDHIQYLCNVDGTRFERESGFVPRYGLRDTIRAAVGA